MKAPALLLLVSLVVAPYRINAAPAILFPIGEIDESSAPIARWICSQGHTEAQITVTDANGQVIAPTAWRPIRKNRAGECLTGLWIGKLIHPPLPPLPPPGQGEIRFPRRTQGGLPLGAYQGRLELRGPSIQNESSAFAFSIVENVFSDFSEQADGWLPMSGPWGLGLGTYSVSGNSKDKRWISVYAAPVYRGKPVDYYRDTRHFKATISLGCLSVQCFGGLITYMQETGATAGISRYYATEIVVAGDNKLYVRGVSGSLDAMSVLKTVSAEDVATHVKGKPSFVLSVHQLAVLGRIVVEIDGKRVWCGFAPSSGNDFGRSGLVASTHDSLETFDVDQYSVSPSVYEGNSLPCRDPVNY